MEAVQQRMKQLRLIARAMKNVLTMGTREAWVKKDKEQFMLQLNQFDKRHWQLGADFFCTEDKTNTTGFDRHYVYHPAWAFRKLVNDIKPQKHIDISSTLHFCSMVSAIMPLEFYDYRPAQLFLTGLESLKADLNNLPFATGSVESISCMHTVEHIGLGRYGDAVDALGDVKAMKELQRVVAPGGSLLFVVPVAGKNAIYFNAHRVYQPEQVVANFSELFLQEFYYIPAIDATPEIIPAESSMIREEKYGCGCFWFMKSNGLRR